MTTARAFSNIAFIKYWGNQNNKWRIPVNPSLSMNLNGLYTETTVEWLTSSHQHDLTLNDKKATGPTLQRVIDYLEEVKKYYNVPGYAKVKSHNNFPTGVGIASSASAFAALALSASRAAGLDLSEKELSALARLGSGSASRSIPAGYVEWFPGNSHETSYAESIAPPDHWNLVDLIAIADVEHKAVGSTQGHQLALSSNLQNARVQGVAERLEKCKRALFDKDFETFAEIVELDSDTMHAVMMTSRPPLMYWQPTSVAIMQSVRKWRAEGIQVCYTMDAGPNVHCLCLSSHVDEIKKRLTQIAGVQEVLIATAGGAAEVITP